MFPSRAKPTTKSAALAIMRLTQNKKLRAFTLLETTMAMYITLMGVLTFAAMAVFANKVGMQAKIRSGAYQIAGQQLEVLRTTSFDNLASATQTSFTVPEEFTSSLPGANNSKYQVAGSYLVEDLTNTTKKISVRIQWRNASANQGVVAPWSEVRLVTQIARPGSVGAIPTPTPLSSILVSTPTLPLASPAPSATTSTGGGIVGAASGALSGVTSATTPSGSTGTLEDPTKKEKQ